MDGDGIRISITYEETNRVCEEFIATKEEVQMIHEGEIPKRFKKTLRHDIDYRLGDIEEDWAAENLDTGKCIQDWR